MKHDLDTRKARALELRRQGYNCAQSVLMVFDDITGLDEATAVRLASGLGTGVGGSKELCGVANAMAIAQGFQMPATAEAKVASMHRAADLLVKFKDFTKGRVRCDELKFKENPIPCNDLILKGIELLHNFFLDQSLSDAEK